MGLKQYILTSEYIKKNGHNNRIDRQLWAYEEMNSCTYRQAKVLYNNNNETIRYNILYAKSLIPFSGYARGWYMG